MTGLWACSIQRIQATTTIWGLEARALPQARPAERGSGAGLVRLVVWSGLACMESTCGPRQGVHNLEGETAL